jgi:thioredoxin-like negative regulator of GroEL
MNRIGQALLMSFLLVISGEGPASAAMIEGNGIQWYSGSVDEAFAEARHQNRPVFLYWGAAWCPPCNQLKATLFRNPAFVGKTRLFVPVYLDGDTEAAQQRGEQFGVLGYPTLILFTPRGEEITRLPGGMSMERYPEVLDLALARVQPVARLLEQILDQGKEPHTREYHLLATYAWNQDGGRALGNRELSQVLKTLAEQVPATLPREKSRLNAQYLLALADRREPPDTEEKADAIQRLQEVLNNEAAYQDNFFFLIYGLETLLPEITEAGSLERKRLIRDWDRALTRLHEVQRLDTTRTLLVYEGSLNWLAAAGRPVPEERKAEIREAVRKARSRAENGHERIAVAYAAYGILKDSGQLQLAEQLINEEMQAGSNNQYWMLVLADLAEEAGDEEAALNWYARAWEKATGSATRIQWSSYYIRQLTRTAPVDDQRIMAVSKTLFAELAKQKTPFHGRSKRALERVFKALNTWGETSRRAELIELKRTFINTCRLFGSEATARCESIMKAS